MLIARSSGKVSKALQIKHALQRVQSYVEAGKLKEVKQALSEKSISNSTLRNWLADPDKALTAYRWTEFVEAVGRLPDLERQKRNDAYDFALTELGIARETQYGELNHYSGFYKVFHDYQDCTFNHIAIQVESNPIAATFAFKYRNGSGRGFCDGLMVTRHGRIVWTGFSRTTIFHAVFEAVAYPARDVILGMGFLEDFHSREVCFSKLAIVRREAVSVDSELIDEHVSGSFISL